MKNYLLIIAVLFLSCESSDYGLDVNENIGAFVESLNTPWGSDERNLLRAWN